MAIAENSYPHKMGSSCLQILDPEIWLSSEISDPKTWHAQPSIQTWQVPPPPGRLAQVHSLDQSTIRVIKDPIDCFLNRDPQTDGKNFQNDTEPTMWARKNSLPSSRHSDREESTWASQGVNEYMYSLICRCCDCWSHVFELFFSFFIRKIQRWHEWMTTVSI